MVTVVHHKYGNKSIILIKNKMFKNVMGNIKVKVTLDQAMKTQRGSRSIALLCL
jgi:hypothetical protein